MTRYEKLKEDYDKGLVPIEKFVNYLNYCPGDEKIWNKQYGCEVLVRPTYSQYGETVGCKINSCIDCWTKEYVELSR